MLVIPSLRKPGDRRDVFAAYRTLSARETSVRARLERLAAATEGSKAAKSCRKRAKQITSSLPKAQRASAAERKIKTSARSFPSDP
jgi:hypothetical protein